MAGTYSPRIQQAVGCSASWHCTTFFGEGNGAMPSSIAPYRLRLIKTAPYFSTVRRSISSNSSNPIVSCINCCSAWPSAPIVGSGRPSFNAA